MKNSVFMEEMDAFTYREKLAKDAVVFIPVGALEQHGSHMAMCVDAALTKAMAGATAEALTADTDGALEGIVCSAINFGYRSQQRSGVDLRYAIHFLGIGQRLQAEVVPQQEHENGIQRQFAFAHTAHSVIRSSTCSKSGRHTESVRTAPAISILAASAD